MILVSFLPVLMIIMILGLQLNNHSYTFKQSRSDVQALYVSEMGIERYKNQIKTNPAYSEVLNFSKTIDGYIYDVQVTSTRFGVPEKVKITSTVTGLNIVTERIITVSRITS